MTLLSVFLEHEPDLQVQSLQRKSNIVTSDIKVPSAPCTHVPHSPPGLLLLTIYYLLFTAYCWKFPAPVVNAADVLWFKQSAALSYWIFL